MADYVLMFLVSACQLIQISQSQLETLYIAGFFTVSRDHKEGALGRGVLPAVQLALEHVNNDSSTLPGYRLDIIWNDTKCEMAQATKQFFEMMHYTPAKVMLFGPDCYTVTGPIAEVSRWWNIWQLAYADMNPELHDRKKYPNLFRTVPSDNDYNPARLAILKHFQWRFVAALSQDAIKGSGRFDYASSALVKMLEDQGYQVITRTFTDDPSGAIKFLKESDIRIIIGNFDEIRARKVFCEAYKRGLYGTKIVWIVLGSWDEAWWRVPSDHDCTRKQLLEAMAGYLATDVVPLANYQGQTVSGKTISEYEFAYNSMRRGEYSKFHGYAYDGIWVIAKALDKLAKWTKRRRLVVNKDLRNIKVHKALNQTDFMGVTGQVKFLNGERMGQIEILQFQPRTLPVIDDGEMKRIGIYYAINSTLDMHVENMFWRGVGPPLDKLIIDKEMARVDMHIYVILSIACFLGIIVAILFAFINIHYRRHRYIKMSSPRMNNMILLGCVMSYCSVFLLGIDGRIVPPHQFHIICTVRCWVLATGFTFAFGSMFSKTWRVHAIFTNIKLNKKVIKDYKLIVIVFCLLLIDLIILITWQVTDPLVRKTKDLSKILSDNGDRAIVPQIEFCSSSHLTTWMGIIYAYKGILLLFGCFLAWETRQVNIPALNDSKYIGMSVYNVVIMCIAGAATSFVIRDQVNANFIIMGLCIIFCTSITLALVFLPKIITIKKDPKGEERRFRATLKKISKKDSDESSKDIRQNLKIKLEQNMLLHKTFDERCHELEEALRQCTDMTSSVNGSPSHFTDHPSTHRRTTISFINSSPVIMYKPSARDNDSIYSTTSVTNLWPVDSSPHRVVIQPRSRNPSIDTRATEAFEMFEFCGRRHSNYDDCMCRVTDGDSSDSSLPGNSCRKGKLQGDIHREADSDTRPTEATNQKRTARSGMSAMQLLLKDPHRRPLSSGERTQSSFSSLPEPNLNQFARIPAIKEELVDTPSSTENIVTSPTTQNCFLLRPNSTSAKNFHEDSGFLDHSPDFERHSEGNIDILDSAPKLNPLTFNQPGEFVSKFCDIIDYI